MKKIYLLFSLTALLFACGLDTNSITPVEYNDAIINEQAKITKLFLASSMNIQNSLEASDSLRLLTVKQCDSSIAVLQKLGDYKGNTQFRNAALDLFRFYKNINLNEYKRMIEILQSETMFENMDEMTAIQEKIGNDETTLDNNFQKAQNEFAKANNIMIAPNILQKQIDNGLE